MCIVCPCGLMTYSSRRMGRRRWLNSNTAALIYILCTCRRCACRARSGHRLGRWKASLLNSSFGRGTSSLRWRDSFFGIPAPHSDAPPLRSVDEGILCVRQGNVMCVLFTTNVFVLLLVFLTKFLDKGTTKFTERFECEIQTTFKSHNNRSNGINERISLPSRLKMPRTQFVL